METFNTSSELENARVSDHWSEQFIKNRTDLSCWVRNQIIAGHLHRCISGGETDDYWLSWLLRSYLPSQLVFQRSLSICCGDGRHEIELAQSGKVKFVHGFDLSQGALQQAQARFQDAGIPESSYHFEIGDCNDLQIEGRFDLILASAALHHVANLEDLLTKLKTALLPEGYFVLLEFVGPNRFQWTDRQCEMINGMLSQLDPHYLAGNERIKLTAPPLCEMLRIDPSEAVRSRDILPLIRELFDVEYESRFNGTVTHMLYPLLNWELSNQENKDFDSIVRMILYFEEQLVRFGALESDFVFMVCRAKGTPLNRRSTAGSPGSSAPRTRSTNPLPSFVPWLECAEPMPDRDGIHVQGWVASNRPVYAAEVPGTPPTPLVIFDRPDVGQAYPDHDYVRGFDGIVSSGMVGSPEVKIDFDIDGKTVSHIFRTGEPSTGKDTQQTDKSPGKSLREKVGSGLKQLEAASPSSQSDGLFFSQKQFNDTFDLVVDAVARHLLKLGFNTESSGLAESAKSGKRDRRTQDRWNSNNADALDHLHNTLLHLGYDVLGNAGISVHSSLKIQKKLREVRQRQSQAPKGWRRWLSGAVIDQSAINTRLRQALGELCKMVVKLENVSTPGVERR